MSTGESSPLKGPEAGPPPIRSPRLKDAPSLCPKAVLRVCRAQGSQSLPLWPACAAFLEALRSRGAHGRIQDNLPPQGPQRSRTAKALLLCEAVGSVDEMRTLGGRGTVQLATEALRQEGAWLLSPDHEHQTGAPGP